MARDSVHFRLPLPRDDRVAACDGYWCSFNSSDWDEVTCADCLMIRDEVIVTTPSGYKEPAFFRHARKEWDGKEYVLVNTIATDDEREQVKGGPAATEQWDST